MKLRYIIAWLKASRGHNEALVEYFRSLGMKIGSNARIFSNISTTESYLIEIGENVTISNDVELITHDNSVIKVLPEKTDIFGKITIGDNCFIGSRAIIMYGVSLANNTIVAAGSVVTKSITEQGKIIGGNPARIIGDTKSYGEKVANKALNLRKFKSQKKELLLKDNTYLISR